MNITHVVPRFFPQFDGLGDYARILGERLRAECGISSRFVVGDPEWTPSDGDRSSPSEDQVCAVAERTVAGLREKLDGANVVILHYVGYGYHSRGVPFWINRAIREWRSGSADRRLLVVFHELWASGPPWKSECYLGWIQRRLVCELHRLSDASVASVPLAWRRLEAIRAGKTILHPVPCNIAAPKDQVRAWNRRGPLHLALFGMPSQREVSLKRHLKFVARLSDSGWLGSVRVIGKGARGGANPSEDVRMLRRVTSEERIIIVADATPEQAGEALSKSDLLLSFYPSRWIFKSGSAMAALANGAVPILPEGRDLEGIEDGKHVFVCSGTAQSIEKTVAKLRKPNVVAEAGQAGREWYFAHADWPIFTKKIEQILRAEGAAPAIPAS